jgi:biopolymer transport protein ExbD
MGMGVSSGPNQVKSDINVTPLVDVVLVLLIIFLITMPVVMRTVTLEVPRKAEANEDTSTASKSIIVTHRADGSINLADGIKEDRSISSLDLTKELRPVLEQKQGEKVVFVDFCDGVRWQDVVSTMDRVRAVASAETAPIKDRREAGGSIKVALKKKDKKSEVDPNKPDPCVK